MRTKWKTAYLSTSAALNAISKAQVVQLLWTSDVLHPRPYTLGPDGPWQAVTLGIGETPTGSMGPGRFGTDLWPTDGHDTYIVANTTDGENALEDSPSATELQFYSGPPPEWFVYNTSTAQSWDAYGYVESILLQPLVSRPITLNRTILVMNNSVFTGADGRAFPNRVGVLGLGPNSRNNPDHDPSILEDLKTSKNITSISFGMHMGSAQHNQTGSLVLGGYEKNRALGHTGIFKVDDSGLGGVFLVDVLLGTQVGRSPYNQSAIGSIYQGIGNNSYAADLVKSLGGRPGSALALPSPSVPYIYLPPGTCETASQYLPVTWNESLELYVWNQSDPRYSTIVKSSAYMALVFADSNAQNLTIKVPFQLLNLTLLPPLVDNARPYFPCKPLYSPSGTWPLGRAFLQAAFYGANHDTQTLFMAQAPGPNMQQRVLKTINENDTSISTNSVDWFEESWSGYWTVHDDPSEMGPTPIPTPPPVPQSGISAGAKAGIAVGSILGGLGISGAVFLLWRRARNKRTITNENQAGDLIDLSSGSLQDGPKAIQELDASRIALDKSDPLPHEMMAPNVVHEAPDEPSYHELPGQG
ncbi:aspartic peptidase domain-containing protein [Nemania sp. NC0429]|nr:aspartic peptidase domain-containing protein [Nemania sp. NC0429]